MNRFADEKPTDPTLALPLHAQGTDLHSSLFRSADTVIIKAKDLPSRVGWKEFVLSPRFLSGVVASLAVVIMILISLIVNLHMN